MEELETEEINNSDKNENPVEDEKEPSQTEDLVESNIGATGSGDDQTTSPCYDHALAAKIRKCLTVQTTPNQEFDEQSLTAIRKIATEVEMGALYVGVAKGKLFACLDDSDLLDETELIDVFVLHKSDGASEESLINDLVHFTVPMKAKAGTVCLMQSFFAPNFIFGENNWPETIKSKLCGNLNEFFVGIDKEAQDGKNITNLYLPAENLNEITPKLIGKLEAAVSHWHVQIDAAINLEGLQNKLPGITDLISFWESKLQNMIYLENQLKAEKIKRVYQILEQGKSHFSKTLVELLASVQFSREDCSQNLEQLNKLREKNEELGRCTSYQDAEPLIVDHLKKIREIRKTNCFKEKDRLFKLLACLGNQIIAICAKTIRLRSLFKGKPVLGMEKVRRCTQDCESFLKIYEQNFQRKQKAEQVIDQKELYSNVFSFMSRCSDLKTIFEAMLIFGRVNEQKETRSLNFVGIKGLQYKCVCDRIRHETLNAVQEMGKFQDIALDVTNNQWRDEMEKFSHKIKQLERKIVAVINSVMDDAANVFEGVNSLQGLLHFLQKDSLQGILKEKTNFVFGLLLKDIEKASKSLLGGELIGYSGYPPYSGIALAAHNSRCYLVGQMLLVEKCNFLADCENAGKVHKELGFFVSVVDETIQEIFDRWVIALPMDWEAKLKRSLIAYHPAYECMIEPTLGRDIFETIQEIRIWKSLGHEAPPKMQELYGLEEKLGNLNDDVQLMCHQYNEAIQGIEEEDFGLFIDYVAKVNEDLNPAMFFYTWSSNVPENYLQRQLKSTLEFKKLVRELNEKKKSMETISTNLAATKIMKINPIDLYSFSEVQEAFEHAVRHNFEEILTCLEKVRMQFGDISINVKPYWEAFYQKINNMLENGVISIIENSCVDILKVFHEVPFHMTVTVDIEDKQIIFNEVLQDIEMKLSQAFNFHLCLIKTVPSLLELVGVEQIEPEVTLEQKTIAKQACRKVRSDLQAELIGLKGQVNEFLEKWLHFSWLWDTSIDDFLQRYHTQSASALATDVESFSHLLFQANLPTSATVAFIKLDALNLQTKIFVLTKSWHNATIKFILDSATLIGEKMSSQLSVDIQKLCYKPQSLQQVAEKTIFCQLTMAHMQSNEANLERLNEYCQILRNFKVDFPDYLSSLVKSVNTDWKRFLLALEDAKNSLEKSKDKFRTNMIEKGNSLNRELGTLCAKVNIEGPYTIDWNDSDVFKFLKDVKSEFVALQKHKEDLSGEFDIFGVDPPQLAEMSVLEKTISMLEQVWIVRKDWNGCWATYEKCLFKNLKIVQLQEKIDEISSTLQEISNGPARQWNVVEQTREHVENLKYGLPIICKLKKSSLRERHWEDVEKIINQRLDSTSEDFTLQFLLSLSMHNFEEEIKAICAHAIEEEIIERGLSELQIEWQGMNLSTGTDIEGITTIEKPVEVLEKIDSSLDKLAVLEGSKNALVFDGDLKKWQVLLENGLHYLNEIFDLQNRIMLLKPQTACQEKLISESSEVNILDTWNEIMARVVSSKNVLELAEIAVPGGGKNSAKNLKNHLEMAEYEAQSEIKTRVKGAPRLYFLNNEELMEFFLKPEFGGEPYRTLIPKCFPGISSFKFGRQANEIVGFVTPSGEMLLFNEIIKISDNIAEAIIALAEMMKDALQSLQIRCCSGLIKNPNKTDRWIRTFPAQTLILAGQIYWTSELDKALESWFKSESKKPLKQMRKEYDGVITRLSENLATNIPLADRQKTTALLTSELFLSKKISDLIKNDWVEPTSLEVLTLMKFYFNEETTEITIIQMFSSFQYAYQTYEDVYHAVITPETERYIIHITTALNLNKYVAIESSRASGKFETIRCLAKTLGRLVLPYCCSNYSSIDAALMAFEVTAKLGAWAVIKNFLDMNKNVLEEVSYHLSRFLRLMNDNEFDSSVTLNGIPISIKLKPAFFLASKGCPNTRGLPASLRAFFRPIVMKGPDTGKILEMLLIAEGFTEALTLSQKLIQMGLFCRLHLSKKSRWIFSTSTTTMTVVKSAVDIKRNHFNLTEEEAILHSLVNKIEPQLNSEDQQIFKHYVSQIFPGIELMKFENNDLKGALESAFQDNGMEPLEEQIKFSLQLFDAIRGSQPVALVGKSISGKTTTLKMLIHALKKLKLPDFSTIKLHAINPDLLSYNDIFGLKQENKWIPGILQRILQACVPDERVDSHWIYFDGQVSDIWLGNVVQLLDHKYQFCGLNEMGLMLTNRKVKILIETSSLDAVSPEIMSAFCSIYFGDLHIGWRQIVQPWIEKFEDGALKLELQLLFSESLQKCFDFKKARCSERIRQNEVSASKNLCAILQWLISKHPKFNGEKETTQLAKKWFYFSVVWGIFGATHESCHALVDEFVRSLESDVFPKEETVFDYFVDSKRKKFVNWTSTLPRVWKYNQGLPVHEILVPTATLAKFQYVLKILIEQKRPVLVSGCLGSGKSYTSDQIMESFECEKYSSLKMSCTAMTSKAVLMDVISKKMQPRSNNVLAHRRAKSLILFIQDLNLTEKNPSAAEIFRQWLDYGFCMNENLQETTLKHLGLIVSLSHRGYDMNLDQRLSNKFANLNFSSPTDSELVHIYGSILGQHLLHFGEHIKVLGNQLVESTVALHKSIKANIVANINNPQCVYSLQILSQVIQGLTLSNVNHHNTLPAMCRLWMNEVQRAYGSRMTEKRLKDQIWKEALSHMKHKIGLAYADLYPDKIIPLIGLYSDKDDERDSQVEISIENASARIQNALQDYNSDKTNTELQLVIVDDTVQKVTNLVRILSQPSYHNIILNGEAGSGRKSLLKLSSFICGLSFVFVELISEFEEFKLFWKNIILRAGLGREKILVGIDGEHICDGRLFELINCISENGTSPGLISSDELDKLRLVVPQKYRENVERFMVQEVKTNLRIAMKLNFNKDVLRHLLVSNPAFLKWNIVAHEEWSYETYLQATSKYISNLDLPFMNDRKEQIAMCFAKFHSDLLSEIRKQGWEAKITPVHLFQCLRTFESTVKELQTQLQSKREMFKKCTIQLTASTKKMAAMSSALLRAQRKVVDSQRQCETALVMLGQKKREVEEQKTLHEKKQHQIDQEEVSIQQLARIAHQAMDEAIPYLEDADLALETIEPIDLQNLRSYGRPPPIVESVISAVMLLKQADPTWAEAKRQLADPTFIEQLHQFDKDHIPEKILKSVSLISSNEDFALEKIELISNGAKLLAQWVLAMEKYGKIYRIAAPKRSKLERASKELREHQAELADIYSKIIVLQNKLGKQKVEYEKCLESKRILDAEVEDMASELQRANDLLTDLSVEEQEWHTFDDNFHLVCKGKCVQNINRSIRYHYFGALQHNERQSSLKILKNLLDELRLNDEDRCVDDNAMTIRRWNLQKLHEDRYLEQSAEIVMKIGISECNQRPTLMYDPQGLAHSWLKEVYADWDPEKLTYLKVSDCELVERVTTSLQRGEIIFILDLTLKFCSKAISILNTIQTADHESRPEIYFFTSVENVLINPIVASHFNIVEFSCQVEGLKNCLLDVFVENENGILHDDRIENSKKILLESQSLKRLVHKLQKTILECKDTILDDKIVMDTLEKTKEALDYSKKTMSALLENEDHINQHRKHFLQMCNEAANFYVMIKRLNKVDSWFTLNLEAFISCFERAIPSKIPSILSPKHRADFVRNHALNIYSMCLPKFKEEHKLLLSFVICLCFLENSGDGPLQLYVDYVLHKMKISSEESDSNGIGWVSGAAWKNVQILQSFGGPFVNLTRDLEANKEDWKILLRCEHVEQLDLPGVYNSMVPSLRLMLIASLRPDRVCQCISEFVSQWIGDDFLKKQEIDFFSMASQFTPQAPIVIRADACIDVVSTIENIANLNKAGITGVNFGDKECTNDREMQERWNISLFPTEEKLQMILQRAQLIEPNNSVRTWVVIDIKEQLQNYDFQHSALFVLEKPQSIQDNMKRLLQNLQIRHWSHSLKQHAWNVSLLHTCILGRQNLLEGKLLQQYDFPDTDFHVALCLLEKIAARGFTDTISKEFLEWTVDVAYLGRIVNEVDRTMLTNISSEIMWEHAFTASSDDNPLQMTWSEDGLSFAFSNLPIKSSNNQQMFAINASFANDLRTSESLINDLRKLRGLTLETQIARLAKQTITKIDVLLGLAESKNLDFHEDSTAWPQLRKHLEQELQFLLYEVFTPVKMHVSDLKEAISGKLVFNRGLLSDAIALEKEQVPSRWFSNQEEVRTLSFENIKTQLSLLTQVVQDVKRLSPITIQLIAFEYAAALLSALKQDLSGHFYEAITLSWTFEVLGTGTSQLEERDVILDGLKLSGACWDHENSFLVEAINSNICSKMPKILMKPSNFVFTTDYQDHFMCPVFIRTSKEAIFYIPLHIGSKSVGHWTRKGVALYA
ncbi:Hypothetical predicted protein [Cloeon dipterum]|uniref:Uncharacterized protein n=1 Tax=Cloeon dipterum TaxID=197152 RepID=A0A8S1CHA0_9INSE|nr:Hypothetical predicted protein [Cloeon dipterum]